MKVTTVAPGDDVYAELNKRLVAFNRDHVDWDADIFTVCLRDDTGTLRGGGRGIVRMGALEVRSLWLDQDQRRGGFGREIVEEIESEARLRGATKAFLDTYDFQAKEFYEGLGYAVFGSFEFPNDTARFYLGKVL
ncbi:MAG: GNAT family N-acetyltransferase [Alphaproteobacteria bacterium]|nr:GNAT family N-acetyltransferase [Alphaproteobacteria bacterium]